MTSTQDAKTSFDDVSTYPLDQDKTERLLQLQSECAVLWTTRDGWPMGVMHRFVYRDERFWVTCARQRKRVPALRARDKSAVIVSSEGTALGRDQTLTVKCTATVHDDDPEIKAWFYRALALKLNDGDERAAAHFQRFLDTPARVIIELVPTKWITYDGAKVAAHVAGRWQPGQPWQQALPPEPAWAGRI